MLKKKYVEGREDRMGATPHKRLQVLGGRRPIWIHGVSVGEVQAASALVRYMRESGFAEPIVISTTTTTGKAFAEQTLSGLYDLHIYYPWDLLKYVRKSLDRINPIAFITVETEIWPNMLWELEDRGIPAFLVNGRISDRSWRKCRTIPGRWLAREVYGTFSGIFLRDSRDYDRLKIIGVQDEKLNVFGNLKIDALLARVNAAEAASWREKFGPGLIFIAGSTHHGEEEIVLEAFEIVRKNFPQSRLIIAPRHPERAGVVSELACKKFKISLFSDLTDGWDVLIVDKIGLLFTLYGASSCAFVGGSLADCGGQNILEPVAWGIPVQYGPHMEDFQEASDDFLRLGISVQIKDAAQLAGAWNRIASGITDSEKLKQLCSSYFGKKAGAAERTWRKISAIIESRGKNDGDSSEQ